MTDNDETRLPRAAARARAAAVLAFVSESVNVLCFESATKYKNTKITFFRLLSLYLLCSFWFFLFNKQ